MIVSTGSLEKVYQPKNTARAIGIAMRSNFLVFAVKVYFNRLVASSGNTSEGLKLFAVSISMNA